MPFEKFGKEIFRLKNVFVDDTPKKYFLVANRVV
jgi:hypothetical protein